MIRLFRVFIPASTFALLLIETLLIASSFIGSYYLVLEIDPTGYLLFENGWARVLPATLGVLLGLHFNNLYNELRIKSRLHLLQQLTMAMGIAFLLQGPINYLVPSFSLPIRCMLLGTALSLVAIFTLRLLFSTFVQQLVRREALLLIGDNPMLAEIGAYVSAHPDIGFMVGGYVRDTVEPSPGGKVVERLDALHDVIQSVRPGRLVVGLSRKGDTALARCLLELRFSGLSVEDVSGTYERLFGRIPVLCLRPRQLIYSSEFDHQPRDLLWQFLWNWTAAAIGFLVTLPLILLAALIVRLSSRGPILDRQICTGMYGKHLSLYTFRLNLPDGSPTLTGRVLQRIHLHRLPLLFNILKGDLAFVGPRPERPQFAEVLTREIPFYTHRSHVRPGITGWAQINCPNGGAAIEDSITELAYDLYYVKNMSLALDSLIVLHAFKAMFSSFIS